MRHDARGSARWLTFFLSIAFAVLSSGCTVSSTAPTPAGSSRASTSSNPNAGHSSARPRSKPGSTVTVQPGGASSNVYDDDGSVGAMARILLGASPARRLVIEVAYVPGRKPTQQALDHITTILRREAIKPDGIFTTIGAQLPDSTSSYSLEDLVGLESKYRRLHSGGSVATVWIAALNGDYSQASGTLGLAFRATAAVLFEDQIQQAANVFVSADAIERSVITHETGHLLALVDIGYHSAYDHEDPQHPHHSKYKTSVMYWAIEDTSIATILSGGPPDDFDQYDRADLASLRAS
jgi:hypothetical protein